MERYIVIRAFVHVLPKGNDVDMEISKGEFLYTKDGALFLPLGGPPLPDMRLSEELKPDVAICLLKLDSDLFKTAFQSFAYANWMKEKAADIDDQGNPLYPTLTRTPETLVMYLMELGISSDTLMRYMYGPENKYMEYRYLVQEFGKML